MINLNKIPFLEAKKIIEEKIKLIDEKLENPETLTVKEHSKLIREKNNMENWIRQRIEFGTYSQRLMTISVNKPKKFRYSDV